jgi:hypothetical protein
MKKACKRLFTISTIQQDPTQPTIAVTPRGAITFTVKGVLSSKSGRFPGFLVKSLTFSISPCHAELMNLQQNEY